jgi:hypothetical protein
VSRKDDEFLVVVIHRAGFLQHCQFTDRAIGQWPAKPGIDQVDELGPCRLPAIEFHPMKPEPHVIEEVECSKRHTLVLRGAANMEVALALI